MQYSNLDVKKIEDFRNMIFSWGKDNFRFFSWRVKKSPYKILISEILLQRTMGWQAEEIFPKFIKKYPNLNALSNANLEHLKGIIKPIGLIGRANTLLQIAQYIDCYHNGIVPNIKDSLKKIKGIGDYVANAVLCFGYNQKVPIVDGNVIRIINRYFNYFSLKKNQVSDPFIWKFASKLLPEENYQLFNYYILDFGGLICKPRNPNCEKCDLTNGCHFFNNKSNN